jgi:excisionase family DNA binding protein
MDTEQRISELEKVVQMAGLATKEVLTFDEAAHFTGISKSYLYKLTSAQKIPYYKPTGKLCYFNRAELTAWLLQNRIQTTEETASLALNYCSKKGGGK